MASEKSLNKKKAEVAELAEKMNKAIALSNDTYKTLQNSLDILRTSINKSSKKLLERFIKMN